MHFYDYKSLNYRINYYDKVGRYQLSTLQKTKAILESKLSKNKTEIKIKTQPYEELLKVLEARERSLEDESQSKEETSENDLQTSTIKNYSNEISATEKDPIVPSEKTIIDSIDNEGIFAVKSSLKSKKTAGSKAKDKEGEKVKATKTDKTKDKLSARQEYIKRSTRHSYALRALKSYIEVNINANEGRIDRIKHVFSLMKEDNMSPNLQSYAGYLEAFSNSKYMDVNEIQNVVDEMKTKGYVPEDILKKCIFKGDQREKIIKVLGFVGADISPLPPEVGEAYSCKLLQPLNDKSFGRGERFPSVCYEEKDISTLACSQLEIESQYSLQITSVDAINKVNNLTLKSRKYLEECTNMWRKKITEAIKNFKSIERNCHMRGYQKEESIYPYIAVVDNDVLVNLLLQQVRVMAETGEFFSPNEKVLYKEMGVKVMNHYFVWLNKTNQVTDKVTLIYKEYLHYLLDPKLLAEYSPREYWEYLKNQNPSGPSIDVANVPWPHGALVKIGSELYDILQRTVAFDPNKIRHKASNKSAVTPAFFVTYEDDWDGVDMKISKHIGTHHLLCKLYREAKLPYLEFDASLVPMLSPPKPWVKHDSGGFLITSTPFVRFNENAIHQTTYYSTIPSKQLNPCFDSLNSLSLCPWIINKPILDLIIDVFRKGGNEELDVPLNPNNFSPAPKISSFMSKRDKAIIWKQKRELKKKKCEASSLWFDCLYKLSIANHFRDKVFWFPHNLDFRGRVYPTPPHFNHLGSDLIRSILLFAEGQPLGKNGLDWLKIQLINLTGFKKRDPHRVRLEFANEKIPEILDSADHPFEGQQWWRTSDKPWQTLACCQELAKALRHPNPEEYVSHFPIHQDGSCNGLQHYAALGRDELGAVEVNLHPSDAPQDVYSGVSALVERERQKDAANGVEVAQKLEGFVRRKVVKQTVMTFVYGVTKYGAKLQILKQLKDIPEFDEKYYHEASLYLMQKIFFSIKEMFTATQEIQDWFTDCAEHITRVSGEPLEWVTPLGLPVIQPYHKEITLKSGKFSIQGKESCLNYTSHFEPYQSPNIRKQKNGFAPNFIHSLDASHMMLTSLFCQRQGITFVSVHDCYWTHASTVEIMNKICREQFVSLHKEPILEDLSAFFLDKYARVVDEQIQGKKLKQNSAKMKLRELLSTVPKKGTFNLEKVLESEYFFS
ncbi:DNA-directed RNA polymerase like protein [Argiope bruennichi]|uniref:DNA-directed RNA polymerase n=1 Tax=Argiope bruennichi TaxID=94029 RepID=A0A8T0EM01_ARGBR|nr:DNA-directed RNA polymerase like protein [Argiope bruennichi]